MQVPEHAVHVQVPALIWRVTVLVDFSSNSNSHTSASKHQQFSLRHRMDYTIYSSKVAQECVEQLSRSTLRELVRPSGPIKFENPGHCVKKQ